MTDNEFINKLKQVPLPFEEYKKSGLRDDYIDQIIESFNPVKKSRDGLLQESKDEVIKLICNYDLTKTNIGMINFFDAPIISDNRIYFGRFEIDWLFLDRFNKEIYCCDEKKTHILYNCSKNGSAFLAAIFEASCFLQKRSVDEELYNNEDIAVEVAKHCAEIAGGVFYLDFYTVLLS